MFKNLFASKKAATSKPVETETFFGRVIAVRPSSITIEEHDFTPFSFLEYTETTDISLTDPSLLHQAETLLATEEYLRMYTDVTKSSSAKSYTLTKFESLYA